MKTRMAQFRDIPFEEVLKCAPSTDTPSNRNQWESRMRGKNVMISNRKVRRELAEKQYLTFICGGPFYYRAEGILAVCAHIIEIDLNPVSHASRGL